MVGMGAEILSVAEIKQLKAKDPGRNAAPRVLVCMC